MARIKLPDFTAAAGVAAGARHRASASVSAARQLALSSSSRALETKKSEADMVSRFGKIIADKTIKYEKGQANVWLMKTTSMAGAQMDIARRNAQVDGTFPTDPIEVEKFSNDVFKKVNAVASSSAPNRYAQTGLENWGGNALQSFNEQNMKAAFLQNKQINIQQIKDTTSIEAGKIAEGSDINVSLNPLLSGIESTVGVFSPLEKASLKGEALNTLSSASFVFSSSRARSPNEIKMAVKEINTALDTVDNKELEGAIANIKMSIGQKAQRREIELQAAAIAAARESRKIANQSVSGIKTSLNLGELTYQEAEIQLQAAVNRGADSPYIAQFQRERVARERVQKSGITNHIEMRSIVKELEGLKSRQAATPETNALLSVFSSQLEDQSRMVQGGELSATGVAMRMGIASSPDTSDRPLDFDSIVQGGEEARAIIEVRSQDVYAVREKTGMTPFLFSADERADIINGIKKSDNKFAAIKNILSGVGATSVQNFSDMGLAEGALVKSMLPYDLPMINLLSTDPAYHQTARIQIAGIEARKTIDPSLAPNTEQINSLIAPTIGAMTEFNASKAIPKYREGITNTIFSLGTRDTKREIDEATGLDSSQISRLDSVLRGMGYPPEDFDEDVSKKLSAATGHIVTLSAGPGQRTIVSARAFISGFNDRAKVLSAGRLVGQRPELLKSSAGDFPRVPLLVASREIQTRLQNMKFDPPSQSYSFILRGAAGTPSGEATINIDGVPQVLRVQESDLLRVYNESFFRVPGIATLESPLS